jgi:hypothetical protein
MEQSLLQTVSVLTRWRFNVALYNSMSSEAKPEFKAVATHCCFPQPPLVPRPVADRIAAFLDGRTHGEDLLHELYDHVLEEPIPQRMRELLKLK